MEEYGEGSMCFEQSGPWEQKGCRQLRLWQKYGGGMNVIILQWQNGISEYLVLVTLQK